MRCRGCAVVRLYTTTVPSRKAAHTVPLFKLAAAVAGVLAGALAAGAPVGGTKGVSRITHKQLTLARKLVSMRYAVVVAPVATELAAAAPAEAEAEDELDAAGRGRD
jgi:hypothetical protein